MKLSINTKVLNKDDLGTSFAKNFVSMDLSPEELAHHIAEGHAYSYQFKKDYRKGENFICSDIVSADIDGTMTLEEAFANKFVLDNALIAYVTASHTEECHRFRLIFRLPRTIVCANEIRAVATGLARKLESDTATVDAGRAFYGHRDCIPQILGNTLSSDALEDLINMGAPVANQSDSETRKGESYYAGARSRVTIKNDTLLKTRNGEIAPLSTVLARTSVHCPIHNDKRPSAFVVMSRKDIKGVRCQACQQTFWPKAVMPSYNFFEFDDLVKKQHAAYAPELVESDTDPSDLVFASDNPQQIYSKQFVEGIGLNDRTTLIKSPKGSGKTEALKDLIEQCRVSNQSVLLIGHRQSLIGALAQRLNFSSYLDPHIRDLAGKGSLLPRYFAVSVDSIASFLKPTVNKFSVVVIDESEQVFSQLVSATMASDAQRAAYLWIRHYLEAASHVVALDADMNMVTLELLRYGTGRRLLSPPRLILNSFQAENRSIELYGDPNHLLHEMFEDIRADKRIFFCSNSLKKVKEVVAAIKAEFGITFPVRSVTGDNSKDDDTAYFLSNIKTEILNYRVLAVSPALGTGIDITFPDGTMMVDGVYGHFHSLINTHYDIDQQLSRVRNPGYVRIWVDSETYEFETEIEPIAIDLAQQCLIPGLQKPFRLNGMPEYDLDDEYLRLYATVLSAQRASKNNIRKNLCDLRRYNGWAILEKPVDEAAKVAGRSLAKIGKDLANIEYIQSILSASDLPFEAYQALKKRNNKKPLQGLERDQLLRAEIAEFYNCLTVTEDLVMFDNQGASRPKIVLFQAVTLDGINGDHAIGRAAALLRELYKAAGCMNESNGFSFQEFTSTNLDAFALLCEQRKESIEFHFPRIPVASDVAFKPVTQLNKFLACCGLKAVKTAIKQVDRKKLYFYRLHQGKYETLRSLCEVRKGAVRSA